MGYACGCKCDCDKSAVWIVERGFTIYKACDKCARERYVHKIERISTRLARDTKEEQLEAQVAKAKDRLKTFRGYK